MLSLYTHPMSPCAQKVRIVLHEKGLQWQALFVDLAQKQNLKPEYLALNPLGVVPTLVHDQQPIIESNIICEYLDDCFPQPPLRPGDHHQKAAMRLWLKHIDTKLHPACGALQWTLVMRPALLAKPEQEQQSLLAQVPEKPRRERQRRLLAYGLAAEDVKQGVAIYRNTILEMEKCLANQAWLAGDSFSLADACMLPYFQTLMQFAWQGFYQDCDKVVDWLERGVNRDSFQQAVLGDFGNERLLELKRSGEQAWPKLVGLLSGC